MNISDEVTRRIVVGSAVGLIFGVVYLALIPVAPSVQDSFSAVAVGIFTAVGVFLWRSGTRLKMLVVPTAAIASLLVAMSVPLVREGYSEVSITATGQKSPQSDGSEVFVSLISGSAHGLGAPEGEGWEQRGDVFVSYQHQPSVLHYRGAWSTGSFLRIARHPHSGIAEVSIGGNTQRLDLFAEHESYVNVPLPDAPVSWRGYVQRLVVAIGLSLFFSAFGLQLAVVSTVGCIVFALTLVVGGGTLRLVSDNSYTGSMEVVAFGSGAAPIRVEMNAGHGFTRGLAVPIKTTGRSITSEFVVQNPSDWKLLINGGSLHVFRDLGAIDAVGDSNNDDNGCTTLSARRCLYEVEGTEQTQVSLQRGDERKTLELPAGSADSKRLFLLVERGPGRITISASRIYVQLSPWEHFSRWISAIRVVDENGKSVEKLVRLQSDGLSRYKLADSMAPEGGYSIPALNRPDTGSFVWMKVFAVLVSISFMLLLAAAAKVVVALVRSYREGRRMQVLALVFGCALWLGLGTVIGWPAIIGWDGFSPYLQSQTGAITLWYGIGYPLLIGGFLLLGPGALVSVWSVLATTVLLLGAAALLLRRGSVAASWLAPLLFCVVLPFTAIMVGMMTHLRDAMNGLMLALFAFCCFYAALKWPTWCNVQRGWVLTGLLLGGSVLALLRIDNVPTLLVLVTGLVIGCSGIRISSLATVLVAGACWLAVGPLVERAVVPSRDAADQEKRLYASTAFINPLTGMLVHGKSRLSDGLYTEIHDVLDEVMDVNDAVQNWSPYNVIYWHQTSVKREMPSESVNARLRKVYVRALMADPMLFIKLRMATFAAMLGHEWLMPDVRDGGSVSVPVSFHDHLLAENQTWRHLSEFFDYAPVAHSHSIQAQKLINWEEKVSSNFLPLIFCVVAVLRCRKTPLAAVVAAGELVRAGVFFFFAPASVFLYLYDLHLLGFLLPLMVFTEESVRANSRIGDAP